METKQSTKGRTHGELLLMMISFINQRTNNGKIKFTITDFLNELPDENIKHDTIRKLLDRKFIDTGILKKFKKGNHNTFEFKKGGQQKLDEMLERYLPISPPKGPLDSARSAKRKLDYLLPNKDHRERDFDERQFVIEEIADEICSRIPEEMPTPVFELDGQHGYELEFDREMLIARLAFEDALQYIFSGDVEQWSDTLRVGVTKLLALRKRAENIDAREEIHRCDARFRDQIERSWRYIASLDSNIEHKTFFKTLKKLPNLAGPGKLKKGFPDTWKRICQEFGPQQQLQQFVREIKKWTEDCGKSASRNQDVWEKNKDELINLVKKNAEHFKNIREFLAVISVADIKEIKVAIQLYLMSEGNQSDQETRSLVNDGRKEIEKELRQVGQI